MVICWEVDFAARSARRTHLPSRRSRQTSGSRSVSPLVVVDGHNRPVAIVYSACTTSHAVTRFLIWPHIPPKVLRKHKFHSLMTRSRAEALRKAFEATPTSSTPRVGADMLMDFNALCDAVYPGDFNQVGGWVGEWVGVGAYG